MFLWKYKWHHSKDPLFVPLAPLCSVGALSDSLRIFPKVYDPSWSISQWKAWSVEIGTDSLFFLPTNNLMSPEQTSVEDWLYLSLSLESADSENYKTIKERKVQYTSLCGWKVSTDKQAQTHNRKYTNIKLQIIHKKAHELIIYSTTQQKKDTLRYSWIVCRNYDLTHNAKFKLLTIPKSLH